jgi:hypothetical protein
LTQPFSRFAAQTRASKGFRNSNFQRSALQDAARCQQTHKLPALLGIGPLEYLGSLGDQFDEPAAEFHVGAFSVLMSRQVAAQLPALFLEQLEALPEEVFRDVPVKAIVGRAGPSSALVL